MKTTEFCYWLQGFFEIDSVGSPNAVGLSPAQVDMIKRHLNLVFQHDIDPSYGPPEKQAQLQATHDGEVQKPPPPFKVPHFSPGELKVRC